MNRRSARIRIGNQTAFSASSVMLPFEYAVANGFDAFEWFPDKKESGAGWTVSDISDEMRDFIRNTAQTRDIILSVHAPWQVNPLLSQGGEHLFECVRFAKDIGASLVNVHLVGDMGIEAYLRALFPWLQILVEAGIRLSIENTPHTCPREFNELFLKLPKLFPDLAGWVGLCLDLGHANLCEETRNDYLKFMDLLQPHVPVIHIHAHENYGDNDSHLTLFTGPAASDPTGITGFVERLGQRQFAGCIILEQWPEPPSLLNNARNNLIDIIENCAVVRSNADAPSFPRKLESSKTHDSWIPAVAPDPDPGFAGMTKDRKMPILGLPPTAPSETASRASFPRRRESRGLHIVDLIAQADRDSKSWRQKLIFMHNFITDEAHELRTEHLVYLAIYLRFIAGGQIASNEDGSHYRPSHHAKMAQAIHDRLSKMAGPDNVLILRKIYPLLPSYDSIFTRGEPLTRIRDIAHRNDIPKELKQEIKHTLQNKLHRCAGPEDLVTSGRLLDRIIAHEADLSPEFVLEFRRFHDELKEFFNARSLEEQLEAVCEKAGGPEADLIQQFLVSKKEGNKPAGLLTTMDLLIALRTSLGRWAGNTSSAEMQGIDLADILLEDYSFVLLSRIINHIEAQKKTPWGFALQCLVLAVANLRLSQFDEEECLAIESELSLWRETLDSGDREQLLRLKASLDRSSRLADVYSNKILSLFPERVEKLGRALGISEHAIRFFSESDIRSHPVFQLSKLVSVLRKRIRELAGLSPWDTIVPGKTSGRLVSLSRLDEEPLHLQEPAILLLEKAEGDEEIPPFAAGIIVSHAIPHLSHLAVRARQANVVLVALDDSRTPANLRAQLGKAITFEADPEGVYYEICEDPRGGERPASLLENPSLTNDHLKGLPGDPRPALLEKVLSLPAARSAGQAVFPLDKATIETAGAKAEAARLLVELSRHEEAGFEAPSGFVVPFGVMEKSLRSEPSTEQEYGRLADRLSLLSHDDFSACLAELAELVNRLDVPGEIVELIMKASPSVDSWMVRSSANLEDLPGLAGAGLYESMVNVPADGLAEAVRAVWSSVWTKRAALSRKNAGIPHATARMAVLIQPMLVPDLSFILHTVNPINGMADEVYAELAVGLGQTLASADVPGAPYRLICGKHGEAPRITAFASFSRAVFPARFNASMPAASRSSHVIAKTIDYSRIRFSHDRSFRNQVGSRLAAVGHFLETAFGRPQDVEGLLAEDGTIFVVQSRPQQGFTARPKSGNTSRL